MDIIDAAICLLLAARIHGTDQALRATAKSLTKQLPRSARSIMFDIMNSKEPMALLSRLIEDVTVPELCYVVGTDTIVQADGKKLAGGDRWQ